MARPAGHFEFHPTDDVPVQMSPRQRLEWEVSQLADGSLSAERRGAVEAALVSDAELRQSYEAHRRLSDVLRESPRVEFQLEAVQAGIMAALQGEPGYGEAPQRMILRKGDGVAEILRGWWFTISATAAALVVGLSIGVLFFGGGGSVVDVNLAGNDGAEGEIEIVGPEAVLRQQAQETGSDSMVALNVTGPDYHAIVDPMVETPLPDYAFSYGTSAVIDTPSRMFIASVDRAE